MLHDSLIYLRCPATQSALKIEVFQTMEKRFSDSPRSVIREGVLYGNDGWFYPLTKGIPRLYIDAFIDYKDFLKKIMPDYEKRSTYLLNHFELLIRNARQQNQPNRNTFSKEWDIFIREHDKTWNRDKHELLASFLEEVDETAVSIKEKFLFDAGCGNGHLNQILGEMGVRNIAMDLSHSVDNAYLGNTSAKVIFIQGDIHRPPVLKDQFDLIYCAGVLVCCKDPESGFTALVPHIKKEGKISIWVYGNVPGLFHMIFKGIRHFTSSLPIYIQSFIYRIVFLPIIYLIKKIKGNSQNAREMLVEIYDGFSPKYRWEFSASEIEKLYQKHFLSNFKITQRNKWGFNTIGKKG